MDRQDRWAVRMDVWMHEQPCVLGGCIIFVHSLARNLV
jgi:hypothetical protein